MSKNLSSKEQGKGLDWVRRGTGNQTGKIMVIDRRLANCQMSWTISYVLPLQGENTFLLADP